MSKAFTIDKTKSGEESLNKYHKEAPTKSNFTILFDKNDKPVGVTEADLERQERELEKLKLNKKFADIFEKTKIFKEPTRE